MDEVHERLVPQPEGQLDLKLEGWKKNEITTGACPK